MYSFLRELLHFFKPIDFGFKKIYKICRPHIIIRIKIVLVIIFGNVPDIIKYFTKANQQTVLNPARKVRIIFNSFGNVLSIIKLFGEQLLPKRLDRRGGNVAPLVKIVLNLIAGHDGLNRAQHPTAGFASDFAEWRSPSLLVKLQLFSLISHNDIYL